VLKAPLNPNQPTNPDLLCRRSFCICISLGLLYIFCICCLQFWFCFSVLAEIGWEATPKWPLFWVGR